MLRNYKRNQQLVDLDCVPNEISNQILTIYDTYQLNSRNGLLNYFIKNKLKLLTESIGEF
jgi:hypothetical protein